MKYLPVFISLIFAIILSIYIGNRGIYIGTDTLSYFYFYDYTYQGKTEFSGINEPLFILIAKVILFLKISFNGFLISVSFLTSIFLLISYLFLFNNCRFKNDYNLIFIFLVINFVLVFPMFWGAQINIIRSGLALPFLYLSIYNLSNNKEKMGVVFILLSGLIHFFNLIFLLLFAIVYILRKYTYYVDKYFFRFYILIVLGYLVGFNRFFIETFTYSFLGGSYYSGYFSDGSILDNYKVGVRYDFALFTLLFVILLRLLSKKLKTHYFDNIFYYSLVLTVPFFLVGHIPYSDRLLFAFWMLIPFIVSIFVIYYTKVKGLLYCLLLFLIFVLPINMYLSINNVINI